MNALSSLSLKEKKILLRVDFNVPLSSDYAVFDDSRIQAAIPTINTIISSGGSVVIMSHLGRPKNGPEERFSLRHIVSSLEALAKRDVIFSNDCISKKSFEKSRALMPGEILLLENLRFYKEEKGGDEKFAHKLSNHGDIYVNDAFGTAHRNHASTSVISQFFKQKASGLLLEKEVKELNKINKECLSPATAIIGGAKVSSKIGVIKNLIKKVDTILIGGGMGYSFLNAIGLQVGASLVEKNCLKEASQLIEYAKNSNVDLILPIDSKNGISFKNETLINISNVENIGAEEIGMDIGPQSIKFYKKIIEKSATIIWNGPMGVFEFKNFSAGTVEIAKSVAKATDNGAYSIVGGGDSVAAIKKFNLERKVSYISTGGGAMLEFLEGKKLPGIIALSN